jgi:hypothetical protein
MSNGSDIMRYLQNYEYKKGKEIMNSNPKLVKVKIRFNDYCIDDIYSKVQDEMANSGVSIKKGSNIALAVGSRGISNINLIVKAVADYVKSVGATPFIVPAMGSHGGATAQGQKKVLEEYGVTEEFTGAAIKSSMEVVELPADGLKNRVYMDKNAYNADGTILINRVKPHTDFHGPFESGLIKMSVIGLGKHKQALEIHRFGVYGLRELIPLTARRILKYGNIILGVGIVENAYDRTCMIKAIKPLEFEQEEKKLLELSRKNMPALPVDKLDILIVDQLGKDISGAGIDTNIIGRIGITGETEPIKPRITNIIVTDITDASHGNALGIGLADFITRKLFDKIDFKSTYENVLTSTFIQRGKIPIIADTCRQAYVYALRTCGPVEIDKVRVIRIKNTLHIDEIYVSESVLTEISDRDDIEVIGTFDPLFNPDGSLIEF